ncbi:MAG: hypothetical protein ACU0BN_15015 [Sulfitobacter sp.]
MSIRPVFSDVVAYARELLNPDEKKIMFEIIKAFAERESEEEQVEKTYQAVEKALDGEMDTNDFDALVLTATDLLREGQPIPNKLAKFAGDVLEGKRSRPTKRGPDPYRDFIRNVELSFAVEAVVQKFGIARYAKGNTNNQTAVDAVSEAAKCTVSTVTRALRSKPIPSEVVEIVALRLGVKLGN